MAGGAGRGSQGEAGSHPLGTRLCLAAIGTCSLICKVWFRRAPAPLVPKHLMLSLKPECRLPAEEQSHQQTQLAVRLLPALRLCWPGRAAPALPRLRPARQRCVCGGAQRVLPGPCSERAGGAPGPRRGDQGAPPIPAPAGDSCPGLPGSDWAALGSGRGHTRRFSLLATSVVLKVCSGDQRHLLAPQLHPRPRQGTRTGSPGGSERPVRRGRGEGAWSPALSPAPLRALVGGLLGSVQFFLTTAEGLSLREVPSVSLQGAVLKAALRGQRRRTFRGPRRRPWTPSGGALCASPPRARPPQPLPPTPGFWTGPFSSGPTGEAGSSCCLAGLSEGDGTSSRV